MRAQRVSSLSLGCLSRIRAPRPVKNLFEERIKNINAKYSFSNLDVGTADRPAPSKNIY